MADEIKTDVKPEAAKADAPKVAAVVSVEPSVPHSYGSVKEALVMLLSDYAEEAAKQVARQPDRGKALDLIEKLK